MQIAILTDSHSNQRNIQRAVDLLQEHRIATVLHCGDIADPAAVQAFEPFDAYFVFGNCDYDRALLHAAIGEIGATCCEEFGRLTLDGRQVAFLHGDDRRRFQAEQTCGAHDLLCYGHSHVAEWHEAGKTIVLNPGALHRARTHTLALYDTQLHRVEILPI